MLNKVHPPRPDWYEEFYASVMETSMKSYEDEVSFSLMFSQFGVSLMFSSSHLSARIIDCNLGKCSVVW